MCLKVETGIKKEGERENCGICFVMKAMQPNKAGQIDSDSVTCFHKIFLCSCQVHNHINEC